MTNLNCLQTQTDDLNSLVYWAVPHLLHFLAQKDASFTEGP